MNYYIQGSPARADEIKAAFEKLGIRTDGYDFSRMEVLFFTFEAKGKTYMMSSLLGTGLDNIILTHPDYKELELPVEPCFKVGDKIEATIYGTKRRVTIREVDKTNLCYFGTLAECIEFSEQGQWHLSPKPHYDIKNFHTGMPVLVRDTNSRKWCYLLYSHYDNTYKDGLCFNAGSFDWRQCIPFEGNEHLLGTTNMCDEQYINW